MGGGGAVHSTIGSILPTPTAIPIAIEEPPLLEDLSGAVARSSPLGSLVIKNTSSINDFNYGEKLLQFYDNNRDLQ